MYLCSLFSSRRKARDSFRTCLNCFALGLCFVYIQEYRPLLLLGWRFISEGDSEVVLQVREGSPCVGNNYLALGIWVNLRSESLEALDWIVVCGFRARNSFLVGIVKLSGYRAQRDREGSVLHHSSLITRPRSPNQPETPRAFLSKISSLIRTLREPTRLYRSGFFFVVLGVGGSRGRLLLFF